MLVCRISVCGPILSELEAIKGLSDTRASYTSSSDIIMSLRDFDGGEKELIVDQTSLDLIEYSPDRQHVYKN